MRKLGSYLWQVKRGSCAVFFCGTVILALALLVVSAFFSADLDYEACAGFLGGRQSGQPTPYGGGLFPGLQAGYRNRCHDAPGQYVHPG